MTIDAHRSPNRARGNREVVRLLLADETQGQTGGARRKRPDKRVDGGAEGADAVNGDGAGEVGADGRHGRHNRRAGDDDAAAQGVGPGVVPDRLAEAGLHGVELTNLVVLLALARRHVRRKDELARRDAEKGRRRQQREKGRRVGRRDGRDALEVENEDLGQHEAQRERDGGRVDGGGQRGGEELIGARDEVLVVQLGAGEAQAAERPGERKGDSGRGHVDKGTAEGGHGADAVKHGNEPKGRRVRDKRDERDVDEVEVGDPGEGHLGHAPARQQEQLRRALGLRAQRAHLIARDGGEREAAGDEQRERDDLGGDEAARGRQTGQDGPVRAGVAADGALDLLVGRRHAGLALATLLGAGRGRCGRVLVLASLFAGGCALGRGRLGGGGGGRVLVLLGGALCGCALRGGGGLGRRRLGRGGRVGRGRAGLALDGFSRHCFLFQCEMSIEYRDSTFVALCV